MSVSSATLLKDAVAFRPALKRSGMLERLFALWFNGLVYNQIWEDPEVDLKALALQPGSRVLTIASAGCNILNYLTACDARITAVDLNPHHMALTRLKIAAAAHLPSYQDFFDFFAVGHSAKNIELYRTYLRQQLDSETQEYWDGGVGAVLGGVGRIGLFRKGLYRHSRSALFLGFVHTISRWAGFDVKKVLEATSLEEQRAIFDTHIGPAFEHWLIRGLSKLPVTVFSLGIPPQQFEVMRRETQRSIVDVFRARMDRMICDFPIATNYFAWQGLSRSYNLGSQKALPRYLQQEHYEHLRSRAVSVRTEVANLMHFLEAQPKESMDRFILLDAQDWMPDDTLRTLWTHIERVSAPGAKVIFRSAGEQAPPERVLRESGFTKFTRNRARSEELVAQDRSGIYGSFHLYEAQ